MQDSIFVCELIQDVLHLDVTLKSIHTWHVPNELRGKPLIMFALLPAQDNKKAALCICTFTSVIIGDCNSICNT